jgi:hypothetical protein
MPRAGPDAGRLGPGNARRGGRGAGGRAGTFVARRGPPGRWTGADPLFVGGLANPRGGGPGLGGKRILDADGKAGAAQLRPLRLARDTDRVLRRRHRRGRGRRCCFGPGRRGGVGRGQANLRLVGELRRAHVEAGEADIAFDELARDRRAQRQHVVVPILELRNPAARADLGLQRPDVAFGGDDLAVEAGEIGALGCDPEREHVAAERRGAQGRDPADRPESPGGDHREAPSS